MAVARDVEGKRGEWRKEESEEKLPQFPSLVTGEPVHQLGHVVKTYPKKHS